MRWEIRMMIFRGIPEEYTIRRAGRRAVAHTAVLARALGIPAVMGLADLPIERLDGRQMIVDGYEGRVYVNPSKIVRREYAELVREEKKLSEDLKDLRDLPAESTDGARIALYVNAGLRSDVSLTTYSGR